MIKKIFFVMMVVIIVATSSCSVKEADLTPVTEKTQPPKTTKEQEQTTTVQSTTAETTTTTKKLTDSDYEEYKVNEIGHIMVVMYHGIMNNPPYHVTKDEFREDLQYMYDHGYRLITLDEFLSGKINVPIGTTPIHLTFDDGLNTTFALKEVDGELVVDENTAIGIIEDFVKEHPDFGKAASLYFHDTTENFEGAGTDKERFDWLLEHGYELGNHTATHDNLSTLSKENCLKEIGSVEEYVLSLYPDFHMRAIAYPFGARPDESFMDIALDGQYNGVSYSYEVGFREGPSGPFLPIIHKDFSKYNAPRVRGSKGADGDLWWYFDYYENNDYLKYISDGNPNTVVVKENKLDNISEEVRASDEFEIITY